jgi:hypothetical protein
MGCHDGIGVTVDQTFSFPRKLPGAAGWRPRTCAASPTPRRSATATARSSPTSAASAPATSCAQNSELLARFFPGGRLDEAAVRAATDLADLLAPSRARALALAKAYRAVVREQSFTRGRDAVLAPPSTSTAASIPSATPTAGAVHLDGRLQLALALTRRPGPHGGRRRWRWVGPRGSRARQPPTRRARGRR